MHRRNNRQLEFPFEGQGEGQWDRFPEESRAESVEMLCRLLSEVMRTEAEGRRERDEREDHESAC